jgi:hypothetical protein
MHILSSSRANLKDRHMKLTANVPKSRFVMAGVLVVVLAMACWTAAPVATAMQPPSSAAQDGFVPIDQLQPREELPAAPLVMAAYSVAWLVIFG